MNERAALLLRQVEQCRNPDDTLDADHLLTLVSDTYHELNQNRLRSQRALAIMAEEVEELTDGLERKIEERTKEALSLRHRFDNALDSISQGILLVSREGFIETANRMARDLLGLGSADLDGSLKFRDLIGRLYAAGEFSTASREQVEAWLRMEIHEQPALYTRSRPDGAQIEVRTVQLPDGACVRTYVDITEACEREKALIAAEREFRTLFENAVLGIYRAGLDGTLIKANPAFAKLHGFENENDLLRESGLKASDWYVDPSRRVDFLNTLTTVGRVDDFLSEVQFDPRHDKIWISETAWLVRDDDDKIIYYEGMITDATERVRAERRTVELSRKDPLTGLLNRRTLMEEISTFLKRAHASSRPFAVLCLDLDGFKLVNDTLGHAAGDLILRSVTRRMQSVLSDRGILARLGGDEFAILVPLDAVQNVDAFAQTLIDAISRSYVTQNQSVLIGVSIGIVTSTSGRGDPDDLLKMADMALYAAKARGKGQAAVFDESMRANARRKQLLESGLRNALLGDEIYLAYQPIVDGADGRILMNEALMRWESAELGPVSPAEFIPVAEESGLIHALGNWALRTACVDAMTHFPSQAIAVNISSVQLKAPQFKSFVIGALAASGLNPRLLELEITENVLISDDKAVLDVLRDLKSLGVRVSLDDFGTGYSSLSYLQRFPFDKIKIDRCFVGVPLSRANAAIVRAMVALSVELDIELVVEGIETTEQAQCMYAAGCRLQQGYLYGKPNRIARRETNRVHSTPPDRFATKPPERHTDIGIALHA